MAEWQGLPHPVGIFMGELLWYTATKKNIVIGKPQITL